jgi:DNA-binding CsgD family transcriptional regulator
MKNKKPFWIKYVHNRIKKNKNFLGFIGGPTGSGKSYSALSMCEIGDPTFNPERIITSMKELMFLIDSGKLKHGSWVLWDEAGIDISSKNWQQLTNKLINYLMQTFRHLNLVLIFTSPYLDFIDASTRKLFHAEFFTESINRKQKTCKLKPLLIQYNSRNRKFYYKYLRVSVKGRGTMPLKAWNIPKPSRDLIIEYEKIKSKFTRKLNKDILKQLEEQDIKNSPNYRQPLTPLQKNAITLMAKHKDILKVSEEMGLAKKTIYFHLGQAHKKGYTNNEFLPENLAKKDTGTD